jgi:phosphoheptose isomerase
MKKTIAMISEHASPLADLGGVDSGGQNVYIAQVAENLARQGYQVDIFTRRDNKTFPDVYEWKAGIRIIYVPAGPAKFVRKEDLLNYMGVFTKYMINFIRRSEKPYDLIHANFWMSGLVAADIKAALGIPFVITFHALGEVRRRFQGEDDRSPRKRIEIERRVVREADAIVAECPQDKYDLIQYYDADPGKISEIPCGFDPKELWPVDKREARRKIGVPENAWVVLQLGRMVPRKGVDTAIQGFARMAKEQNINARMVIVGGESRKPNLAINPEIGRLQKIAEEEGVLDRVIFSGQRQRKELKDYFSAADVFISTPWYEPFGITPIESMACGTPVIGSNVGGIKYTVVDGQTGYLVPPNDPQAIARKLTELYCNPEKLSRFSQQALKRVNELFTWEKVGEMMAEFYESVLAKRALEETGLGFNVSSVEHAKMADEATVIAQGFETALHTLQRSKEALGPSILEAAKLINDCLDRGGKLMICGNGGSAADAQHFSAELVGRFVTENRRGLPAMALTADSAFLTAWSNDIGYESVFSRQVQAYGQPGDLLVGISTSGQSKNLIHAFNFARSMNIKCLALLGTDGGDLLPLSDAAVVVPVWNTQRIQEVQTLVFHLLCELVEMHINGKQLERELAVVPHSIEKATEKSLALPRLFSMNNERTQR